MENNFDLLKGFTSLRDFAICMSRSNICCHKANCFVKVASEQAEEECRRCWLDFLTDDKGLDMPYEKEDEVLIRSVPSPIKLSEKSIKILKDKKSESKV